jgi:hypothetical protein
MKISNLSSVSECLNRLVEYLQFCPLEIETTRFAPFSLQLADQFEIEALKLTLIEYDVGDTVLTLHVKTNLLCICANK